LIVALNTATVFIDNDEIDYALGVFPVIETARF